MIFRPEMSAASVIESIVAVGLHVEAEQILAVAREVVQLLALLGDRDVRR